jgi:dephospho-CoA kinase
MRIGLTGGIASGKSTVADMFAALGIPVIDTDVIARRIVEPGQPALEEIRSQFGEQVLTQDGELDRAAMRKIVFSDEHIRRQLEAILHPRIRAESIRQAHAAGGEYQILVVPLLAESPISHFVDRVLVVDCDEDTQLRRLLARDTETVDQARRIVEAQASRDERLAIADDVIENDGGLEDTELQVEALHRRYLQLARARADL